MALTFSHNAVDHPLELLRSDAQLTCITGDHAITAEILHAAPPRLTLRCANGRIIDAVVWRTADGYAVQIGAVVTTWQLVRAQKNAAANAAIDGIQRITAPLPGRIISVSVQLGDTIPAGHPLLIIEAMKMQNEIAAPRAGLVRAIHVQPGQAVESGMVMLEME